MPELSAVDWMFLAVLALSMLLGLWRGLVRESFSLIGWVAAFYVAQLEAPRVAGWLPMNGSSEMLRYMAGFVVAFIGVLVLVALLASALSRFLSVIGLGLLDRGLGGVFGLARGVVVLLAVAVVVGMTPLAEAPAWREARGTPWLIGGLHLLKPMLPAEFGKFLP